MFTDLLAHVTRAVSLASLFHKEKFVLLLCMDVTTPSTGEKEERRGK